MKKFILIAALCCLPIAGIAGSPQLAKCTSCHSATHKVKMCTGFAGLYGSPAGKAEGVRFSEAFKNADWNWDDEHLRKWMCNSKNAIKEFSGDETAKTRMPNMKICNPEMQDEVLAALEKLK